MHAKKLSISQGLRRRRYLKGAISTFTNRIQEALVYDKDSPPAFSYEDSTKGLRETRFELINLESAIARVNATTWIKFQDKAVYLTWVIRTLAELKSEIARLERYEHQSLPLRENVERTETVDTNVTVEVPNSVTGGIQRSHPRKEIVRTRICNLTQRERAEKIELLQKEFNELNDLLETANHTTVFEYEDQPAEDKASRAAPQTP